MFRQNLVSNSWDILIWTNVAWAFFTWTNVTETVGIYVKDGLKNLSLKLGQMWPEQMLRGQMSPWQLESVLDGPKNLPLKFGKISWVTAEILLILSFCGGRCKEAVTLCHFGYETFARLLIPWGHYTAGPEKNPALGIHVI